MTPPKTTTDDQLQRRERADEAPPTLPIAEAQGHSEQTIDAAAKATARFEAYTRYKDFKTFHIANETLPTNGAPERRACTKSKAV